MCNECGETPELTAADIDYLRTRDQQLIETQRKVDEMHSMLTEFSKVLNMAASNPMLSAFLPRGL